MTDSPDQIVTAAILQATNQWVLVRENPSQWARLESATDGPVITVRVEPSDVDQPATEVQLLVTPVRPAAEVAVQPSPVGTMDQPDGTAA